MCLGDWKLGRLIVSAHKTVSIGISGTSNIAADRQRVGLMVALRGLDVLNGGNGALTSSGAPVGEYLLTPVSFYFTMTTHGDLPTHSFVLTNFTATGIWGITEWFLPEAVLQEALEWIKQEYKPRPK